jgi:hypothetical protein
LHVDLHAIKKNEVVGLLMELNTVKCLSLSPSGFLENNDINVTAFCFEVDFSKDQCLTLHASPCFWEFVFEKPENRMIKVADSFDLTKYTATTSIRLAFKKYEMQQFNLDMSNLDPSNGTFANSQKVKVDKMKDWGVNKNFRLLNLSMLVQTTLTTSRWFFYRISGARWRPLLTRIAAPAGFIQTPARILARWSVITPGY